MWQIREKLDTIEIAYKDIDDFCLQNNINSDKHYYIILRAGITLPKVFLKRDS